MRYNPFDLSCVHVYYAGRFVQKAKPAKLSRWNAAAKAGKTSASKPAATTGIKPLEQLAGQHKAQKQKQAKELLGQPAKRNDESLTLPHFIRMIASILDKKPDAFHAREIEALQSFWGTYQPLTAECVGIATGKATLNHGRKQHIDVYLEAIKTLHLKANRENKS